jgi:hypothetical protein
LLEVRPQRGGRIAAQDTAQRRQPVEQPNATRYGCHPAKITIASAI